MTSGRITSNHFCDKEHRPTGGTTFGPGFTIGWQNGPLGRGSDRIEQNGAFVEDVILAALDRIEHYQNSPFECTENEHAIAHLKAALDALALRTRVREKRGVEGTWTV